MADEAAAGDAEGVEGGDGSSAQGNNKKCPECPPPGLPGWMATFSDMVTLLLTFFVLLISFAKFESAKYEAALGSVRNAFGGNVLKYGIVIQNGKSADDQPTMLDSDTPVMPFPIEFLTMEGLLDKHEINRFSQEDINQMRRLLSQYGLLDQASVEGVPEGFKVKMSDKIFFKEGTVEIEKMNVAAFEKMINMLKAENWIIIVEGFASLNENSIDGNMDAFELSSLRAISVSKILMKKGIDDHRVTTVFYGDSRPEEEFAEDSRYNRRVEFTIRKTDLRSKGHKIEVR